MILGDVRLPNMRGVNRGLHVLLVEDDDDDAAMLRSVLEADKRVGQVWRCADGEAALAFLRDEAEATPDLVIADVNMPRMDGFAFLSEVRGDKALKATPVVVMTSSNQALDYHHSLTNRANTFITKPHTHAELTATLKKLIRAFIWEDALPPLFAAEPPRPQAAL